MFRKQLIDYVVYLAVRVFLCVVQALPLDTCDRLSGAIATLFHSVLKIRRRVVEENLKHAYPDSTVAERKQIAWRMWHHLFLMVAEIAHARRKIHVSNWRDHVRLGNQEALVRGLLDPRPKVLVTAHFGNFELAGFLLGMFGFPTVTVARPLDNPYLDRFLNEFRGATGQYMVPKHGSSQRIASFLEKGAALTLLGDQAAGPKGCWIQFFGRPASTHKAIAVFSLANEGPLLVTYGRRLGRPLYYEAGLTALADPAEPGYNLGTIPELTQWFSDRLEETIRRAPEQYWWLHRRWKGEPSARRRKRAA